MNTHKKQLTKHHQNGMLLIEYILGLTLCLLLLPHLLKVHTSIQDHINTLHNTINLTYEWYFAHSLITNDNQLTQRKTVTNKNITLFTHNETIRYTIKQDRLYRTSTDPTHHFCISKTLKKPTISSRNHEPIITFQNFPVPISFTP